MAFICIYVCVKGVHTHVCMCHGVQMHICIMYELRPNAYMYVSIALVRMCRWRSYAHMHVSMTFICIHVCINCVRMRICMCQWRSYAHMYVSMAFIRTYVCVNGVHTHIGMCQWHSYTYIYMSIASVCVYVCVNGVRMHICMCQWRFRLLRAIAGCMGGAGSVCAYTRVCV